MNLFLTPEVMLLLWAVFLLVLETFMPRCSPKFYANLVMGGIAVVLATTWIPAFPAGQVAGSADPVIIGTWGAELYKLDGFAVFFKRFFLITAFIVVWMTRECAHTMPLGRNEFTILPLFTTVGMMLLASAGDLMTLFVALELVTISFYVLVAYQRNNPKALEAGVKYLIVGALSTAFLVYGMSFIYGTLGKASADSSMPATSLINLSTNLIEITNSGNGVSAAVVFGMTLLLVGICFKIAAVPFHMWVPDVYQGAPTPVTAFLSVGSKAAGFVLLLRMCEFLFNQEALLVYLTAALGIMAALSILLGNLAAIPQRNLKRLLGYSSIGHAGFILLALAGGLNELSVTAVYLYLLVYLFASLLAFYIITLLADQLGGEQLANYEGLSQRSPFLAFALTVAFVSLAGIPPLAGFLGKAAIFVNVWQNAHWALLVVGFIGAIAGLYYYLGVVRSMYWVEAPKDAEAIDVPHSAAFLVTFLLAAIIILGFWQAPLFSLIASATQ